MQKSDKVQIFCLTHKIPEYGLVNDEMHTPLQVGVANVSKEKIFCSVTDSASDSISKYNPFYRELTGIYWIWKNFSGSEIIGTEHYRRRWPLTEEQIIDILKEYEVICTRVNIGNTIFGHYCMCHSEYDFNIIGNIIKKDYPEYFSSFLLMKDETWLITTNCLISNKEFFYSACEFVFGILNKFVNLFGGVDAFLRNEKIEEHIEYFDTSVTGMSTDYQRGIFGFLSERLFHLYITHNVPSEKIYFSPIISMESN